MLGVTCDGLASHPGGVAILLVSSCYGNRDKLRRCGPLGSCADFTFTFFVDTKHDITVSIVARLLLTRRLMLSQFTWLQPNTDRLNSPVCLSIKCSFLFQAFNAQGGFKVESLCFLLSVGELERSVYCHSKSALLQWRELILKTNTNVRTLP